jgi:hypothetical protein
MKLSIYIKNHLLSDIIVLLILSGAIYLAADMWNKNTLQDVSIDDMVRLNNTIDKELS